MKKILVIHPDDRSTDFLKPIYAGLEGEVTVVNGGFTKSEVRVMIEKTDQTIMLGHGSPNGLFSMGDFMSDKGVFDHGFIIDDTMIAALGTKPNIFIWCHADKFVQRFHLKGFYTGMFISEYGEADYCKTSTKPGDIESSNDLFAKVVGEAINMETHNLFDWARINYYIKGSKVNDYNRKRLYHSSQS